jgi:hypothetical protein
MDLTDRERAAVLAGLRLLQHGLAFGLADHPMTHIEEEAVNILTNNGRHPPYSKIGDLRDKLNAPPRLDATPEQIARARRMYGDDDIAVDGDAVVSEAECGGGVWVSAWVWVGDEEEV